MTEWLQPLLRGLHYALLLGLFGVTAYGTVGPRGLAGAPSDRAEPFPLATVAVAALAVSAALMLVMIAAMMGQTVGELEWASIEPILMSTSIGWAFGVRALCLTSAIVALVFARTAALPLSAALFAVALATLPWSGHAAVGEGTRGMLHRANDVAHLFAAGVWIGAILWFGRLVAAARRDPIPEHVEPLLGAMRSFAPVGVALVGIVGATGLINSQLIADIVASPVSLASEYGRLLVLKVALVALMLVFAARNAHAVRRPSAGRDNVLQTVQLALRLELASAAAVLGSVALLGLTSPPAASSA